MASSAHKTEDEKKEYFDSPDELEAKVDQLAQWVRESSHFIAFTGAGISTSTGIADYRSGYDTVLKTGPGAWEKRAQGKVAAKKATRVQMQKAIPSPTHMAFVRLMQEGLLKFVVSQNVDGLHRKSGIPPEKLAELHGNTNLERCKRCGMEYMRDFRVRNNQKVHSHETGRKCDDPECRGDLVDTIINFGENLDSNTINAGFQNGMDADLCLAMGSSLRVTPAADIPRETARRGGRLVIVNLQKTPLDGRGMVIHAMCDTVMNMLMERLQLEIPPFKLIRRLKIEKKEIVKNNSVKQALEFSGIDVDAKPYSIFTKVDFKFEGNNQSCAKQPFRFTITGSSGRAEVTVHFQGHYGEPPLKIPFDPESIVMGDHVRYTLVFDPSSRQWEDIRVENQ